MNLVRVGDSASEPVEILIKAMLTRALLSFPILLMPAVAWLVPGAFQGKPPTAQEALAGLGVPISADSAMHYVTVGDAVTVGLLGEAGVEFGGVGEGVPPLLRKAVEKDRWGVVPVVASRLTSGQLNVADESGKTVLVHALERGTEDAVAGLLDRGADPRGLPAELVRQLVVGSGSGRVGSLYRVMGKLPLGHPLLDEVLETACGHGDAVLAALALRGGAAADGREPGILLTKAAEQGSVEVVRLLLRHGADPALAPGALVHAVKAKRSTLITELLEAGADPNAAALGERSALHVAFAAGDRPLVEQMFRHGGSPEEFVDVALSGDSTDMLDLLLASGLSPNRADSAGNPMLVRAVLEGKPGLVRYLLDRGADPRITGTLGQSPFHVAVVEGNRALVDLLIERGADVNAPFGPLVPEFEERVKSEHFVKWLKRDKGLTPLMHAAATGDFEMVAHLMAKGAKRGLTSRGWKRYPVQFACDTNSLKAAQVLLGRKPDEAEKAGVKVVISLKSQRAQLYKGGKVIRSSRVSTGRRGYATPKGEYVITDKQVHWVSTIYHVAMPYFMRLSCREIGLHAGVCPGYPASHGCIRMPHGEVRAFFGVLKIGDPVIITD